MMDAMLIKYGIRICLPAALVAFGLAAPGCGVLKGGGEEEGGEQTEGAAQYEELKRGEADRGEIQVTIAEVGIIEPVKEVEVKSVLSGKAVHLRVEPGDRVRRGDEIAVLEPGVDQSRDLSHIRAQVDKAALELEDARIDRAHEKDLLARGFASGDSVKEAEKRYQNAIIEHQSALTQLTTLERSGVPLGAVDRLQSFRITAPAAGVITEVPVEEGEVVTSGLSSFNAGTVICKIADLSALRIKAAINEVDRGKIALGMPVRINLDAYRGQTFQGRIDKIAPAARREGEVRVFETEISVEGGHELLYPGMSANIDIEGEKKDDVLKIPIEALFHYKGDEVAYLIEEGVPKRTPVKVGLISLEEVEILDGLAEGDVVALEDPDIFLKEMEKAEREGKREKKVRKPKSKKKK